MGEAKLYGKSGGGLKIDGIIKDYYAYAGENISAGDFVEFVNGVASSVDYGMSTPTQVGVNADGMSAVELDYNRVLIVHTFDNNRYLYGVVCTFYDATIIVGTDTLLSNVKNSGSTTSVVKLNTDKVFIAHSKDTDLYLYGVVCNISGTTITSGTDIQLSGVSKSGSNISLELLDNGNIYIVHSYATNFELYSMVITISGTTITAGTDLSLVTYGSTGIAISTELLNENRVFVAHSYSSNNYYLYGIVCSISGTTISKGTDTQLSSITYSGQRSSTCILPNGNVFISHSYGNQRALYGIVCSISGTTINAGIDTAINSSAYVFYSVSSITLQNGNVFILYGYGQDTYLAGTVCTIEDKTITNKTTQILAEGTNYGTYVLAIKLSDGNILGIYGYAYPSFLYSQLFSVDENNIPTNQIIATEYETQVRKATTNIFNGVSKTNGIGGDETEHKDKVSIYQPSHMFNLIPDFSFEKDEWHDANYSSDVSHSGKRSLYFPAGTTYIANIEIARPIVGHKYYGRRYIKSNGDNQPDDCRFEVWGADGENVNWVYAWNNGNHPNWEFNSAVHKITSVDYPETQRTIIRCFNVNTTADTWVDDLLLIDLTEIFGTGNEPTKEWCDKYL